MALSTLIGRVAIVVAAAMLGGALTGCANDTGVAQSSVSQDSGNSAAMRYYGGPKSPMWPDR